MIKIKPKQHGHVTIGDGCSFGEYVVIGYSKDPDNSNLTSIGKGCILGSHISVCRGTKIGEGAEICDFVFIGEDVKIGKRCRVIYGAQIHDECKIGEESIIAGFIPERTKIGKGVKIFGSLLHSHRDPSLPWDGTIEDSPNVRDGAFVGFGALVIGDVVLGKRSYVCAGAIVTRDVPDRMIASGVNEIIKPECFKGDLGKSKFFQEDIK